MAEEFVDIRVRMQGAREAGAEAKVLGTEILGTGKAADEAAGGFRRSSAEGTRHGKVLGSLRGRVGALTLSYREAAKGILAAGAAFGTYEGIKSATEKTVELGSTTLKLSRNLGLTTKAASEWAAVADIRGIDAKGLNMGFTALSRNVQTARGQFDKTGKATGKQALMFQRLGLSQKDLTAGSKDFQGLMLKTADGFGQMAGGTERAAAAQALFGRGAQTIVPLFKQGSETIREQLALAEKYGATFGGSTTEKLKNFIKAEHESKFAMLGLQIAIGTKVLPVVTKVIGAFAKFTLGFRNGTGAGGRLRDQLTRIWQAAKPVVQWFGRATRNVIAFASNHPGLVKIAAALFLATRATRLLNSALLGLPMRIGSKIAANIAASLAASKMAAIGATAGTALGAAMGPAAAGLIVAAITYEVFKHRKDIINAVKGDGGPGTISINDIINGPRNPVLHPHAGRPGRGKHGEGVGVIVQTHTPNRSPLGHHGPSSSPKRLAIPVPLGSGDTVVHTHVHLDGKEIAVNTAKHTRSDRNRR